MNRSKELIKKISSNIDAVFITSVENRRYFSLCDIHTGYLLITRQILYYIVDFRYYEIAVKEVLKSKNPNLKVVFSKDLKITLKELITENNIKRIVIERENLIVSESEKIYSLFSFLKVDIAVNAQLDDEISNMRFVKSIYEIEKMKRSQQITENAFNYIVQKIKPGISEKDIALDIEFHMRKNGASSVAFDLIVISGEKTSLPHGTPGDRKICENEFLIMDMGAVFEGYHSDMTRTVAIGDVSDEQKKIYNIVLQAQLEAIETLKDGVKAGDVDKAARDVINSHGYAKYFGHSTGHGVGLKVHEAPKLSISSEEKLKSNAVVTIEPGIYLPGKFGVRIEDMLLVKKDGCENFTNITKELICLNKF
ncbi:MAG: aminopeptidase P family protein [Oscillospiraceae bacterium]|nr:aminopeptidase P family protein [Oscillospiraceae bacterium]